MKRFESFAVVDWSAANDTGPKPKKDAIWAGAVLGGDEQEPVYLRNRDTAGDWIAGLIHSEKSAGRRLLVGFDFPFGYPKGFAKTVTGSENPLDLWDFYARELSDTPKKNNRFELAGRLNAVFPGIGPFWFHPTGIDVPDLPLKGTARQGHGMPERRKVETIATSAFTCWQLGGAGAVGSQVITGMATLAKLRARCPDDIAIWPFETLDRSTAFVEIWPSLINEVVKQAGDTIKDRAQVRFLARALANLPSSELSDMLNVDAPEEGWILGVGHEDKLQRAARERASNDCFALPAGVDWLPVNEALLRLKGALEPVTRAEILPLSEAGDRILAKDHVAQRDNPPAANAAVDGWGFALDAPATDPTFAVVEARAAPGQPYEPAVPPGRAIHILTGALLPQGVNTVVLDEDSERRGGKVHVRGRLKPGANARKAGEDVRAGDVATRQGVRLRPTDLALLAASGLAEVQVRKALRVAVLSTGSELSPPGEARKSSETNDANRPMLLDLVRRWGHDAIDLGIAKDDPSEVARAMDQAARNADALLTSGGASASDEDHVSALLSAKGTLTAWRIALKPGRPLALGHWGYMPVFGLPGNPVAAFVCSLIFARPALSRLAGGEWYEPLRMTVPAGFEKRKRPGRREYPRARLNDQGEAELFASEGSGRVSGLSWADGLVELPHGAIHVKMGDPVTYLPFSGFGI